MTKKNFIHTEGIVLKCMPFKEYDKIITLFTPEEGLLNLFVKGSRRSLLELIALTTPFTAAEYLYSKGNSTLGRFQEGALLNQHLKLRDSFSCLQAAEQLSCAISTSQWPGKPSPQLYMLFRLFLEKLPLVSFPSSLVAAFLLKILKADGSLQSDPLCSICHSAVEESFRFRGERFCRLDAPPEAFFFTPHEESLFSLLAHSRAFSDFLSLQIDPILFKKIFNFFEQTIVD